MSCAFCCIWILTSRLILLLQQTTNVTIVKDNLWKQTKVFLVLYAKAQFWCWSGDRSYHTPCWKCRIVYVIYFLNGSFGFILNFLESIPVFANGWSTYIWSHIDHFDSFWWSCYSGYCIPLDSANIQVWGILLYCIFFKTELFGCNDIVEAMLILPSSHSG